MFICLAAIVLCIIRKKFKLRRADLPITFIHTIVTFIGGEDLRMRHKWERWFFGILLIGAFFITSVYGGTLLDYFVQSYGQKMTKIEQLIGLELPIFVPLEAMDAEYANEILRFVSYLIELNIKFYLWSLSSILDKELAKTLTSIPSK